MVSKISLLCLGFQKTFYGPLKKADKEKKKKPESKHFNIPSNTLFPVMRDDVLSPINAGFRTLLPFSFSSFGHQSNSRRSRSRNSSNSSSSSRLFNLLHPVTLSIPFPSEPLPLRLRR
jgi:hypothetical protein